MIERLSCSGGLLRGLAIVMGVLLLAAGPACAQAPVPATPEDPTAAKAYAVFDQHCARCHQVGKVSGHPPVNDFGNILDVAALAQESSLIQPGNPDGSRIYSMMMSRAMPYDIYHEGKAGEAPQAKDLDAVRSWIQGLKADDTCKDPTISAAAERDLMERAIEATPAERRPQIRFISLAHLHNTCAGPKRMKAYRQGVMHLVNSLSWVVAPVRLDALDPAQTILRIDLTKLGWSSETWERLTSAYPYASAANLTSETLRKETAAAIPVVRGDWFAFAASRAPLYYYLLNVPDRSRTLASILRVDLEGTGPGPQAKRAAIKTSAVGQGSRIIERFTFPNGGYWRTLEFAPGANRADPFDAASITAGRTTAKADASLTLLAMPNGFSAFFMTNGEGQRINDLPSSVVRDPAHRLSRVSAGISCFGCHSQGIRGATDEFRALVTADRAATKEVKERVAKAYPDAPEFSKTVRDDIERVSAAHAAAGLDPALTLDGVAPVVALSARYERPAGARDVAAELGVTKNEFAALADKLKGEDLRIVHRLLGGTVPRRDVEMHFSTLAAALSKTPAMTIPAGPNPALQQRDDALELILTTDRASYRPGDLITISARTNAGCYLTIVNIDRQGRGTMLFPNEFEQSNFIEAGRDLQIPGGTAPYQFRVREKGQETVVGICSSTQKIADGIKTDYERQRFTELGDYRAFLNRTFDVEGPGWKTTTRGTADPRAKRPVQKGKQEPIPAAQDGPRRATQTRTAILIDVK